MLTAAAWSVPAVSVVAASPSFATSGAVTAPLTHTASLFWRPTTAEANAFGEGFYWAAVPATTIFLVVTLSATDGATVNGIEIAVDVPVDNSGTREFEVVNASDLVVAPAVGARTARPTSGRVAVAVPQLSGTEPKAITVAISAPTSLSRGDASSWPVTVLPGSSTPTSVPVMTYTQFRNAIPAGTG